MASEENLMVLKMLQEGRITAEQAAALLQAIDSAPAAGSVPASGAPPVDVPPPPIETPLPADDFQSEAVARARARIAAARERVAGVQEKLAAAEERIDAAEASPNPIAGLADALRDVPGVRSVVDALKGIEPGRIAADARRQARRLGKTVRDSLEALPAELGRFDGAGEPVLREPREVVASVAPGQTVRLRNPFGSVDVSGGQIPDVRVAATIA
ncbi:MAG: SHOCT-like domain-containing protein, partial [Armatimonadota bacterium]